MESSMRSRLRPTDRAIVSPDELRRHAEECLRWACEAQEDGSRKQFLEMANAWTSAAADANGGSPVAAKAGTPVIPFLRDQEFAPEVIDSMSVALERVYGMIGLAARRDPAAELLARKIIEYAQSGIQHADALIEAMQKDFDVKP